MPDILQPVAETLLHPPLIVCRPHLQPEILTGTGQLPRFAQPGNALSYGGIFTIVSVPEQLGRTSGGFPIYDLPLVILHYMERLATGLSVMNGREELHQLEQVVRWFSLPLSAIEFQCLPGVSFVFSYLYLS